MKKSIQIVAILGTVTILIAVGLLIRENNKDTIIINTDDQPPIELVGGGGGRIYLRFGTIYGFKDDPEKEYRIVAMALHVTQKQLARMVFFNTPEEAEAAGYKASESFQEDYKCVKQGKNLFDCPES